MRNPFRYFNSSPEVIRLTVMMYVRYPLSLRQVEDLLFERGIDLCHETVRFWWNRFGPIFTAGARRLYARGLSGRGVRIGIDDTIVDYTQSAEFGDRVKLLDSDGASLVYAHPFGDQLFSDVDSCQRSATCQIWEGDSDGDDEALNRWVQQIVSADGWPTRDDSVFVVDEYYSEQNALERLFRWWEIPTPYGEGAHGTVVASVAAGANRGVAPEAMIIPIARNFSDDQVDNALADAALRTAITLLSSFERGQLDELLAGAYREDYSKFDIINRSYGIELFDPDVISAEIESELLWYRRYLPKTMNAVLQVGTPGDQKTILVYAAGNSRQPWSGLGADLPYYIPELRAFSLAVAATNPSTGNIADYSNRCGPLPSDWNAATHGRHYCLAAPGTVRGLVPDANTPGRGDVRGGLLGTSYAAPVVSGALALLMEHFRGTRGNTAIVKRMVDTADRSGRYADLETYGAGHLNARSCVSKRWEYGRRSRHRAVRRSRKLKLSIYPFVPVAGEHRCWWLACGRLGGHGGSFEASVPFRLTRARAPTPASAPTRQSTAKGPRGTRGAAPRYPPSSPSTRTTRTSRPYPRSAPASRPANTPHT